MAIILIHVDQTQHWSNPTGVSHWSNKLWQIPTNTFVGSVWTRLNRINSFSVFQSGLVAMAMWWPVNKHGSQLNHSPFSSFLLWKVPTARFSTLMPPLRRRTPMKVFHKAKYAYGIKQLYYIRACTVLVLRSLWHVLIAVFESWLFDVYHPLSSWNCSLLWGMEHEWLIIENHVDRVCM